MVCCCVGVSLDASASSHPLLNSLGFKKAPSLLLMWVVARVGGVRRCGGGRRHHCRFDPRSDGHDGLDHLPQSLFFLFLLNLLLQCAVSLLPLSVLSVLQLLLQLSLTGATWVLSVALATRFSHYVPCD